MTAEAKAEANERKADEKAAEAQEKAKEVAAQRNEAQQQRDEAQKQRDEIRTLADRLQREAGTGEERIVLACRLTLGRRPSAEEIRLTSEFLRRSPLREFCRALVNVNEFLYID